MLQAKKLSISAKSTITASKQEIAIEVQSKLRAEGIDIAVEGSARHLGVDFCGGRRRILPVQQLRLLNSSISGRQVSVLGKATKQATRLVMTGVKQRFYSYAAMVASPTTQKRMRALSADAQSVHASKASGFTVDQLRDQLEGVANYGTSAHEIAVITSVKSNAMPSGQRHHHL